MEIVVIPLSEENSVLVQFNSGMMGGVYIASPTGWRPSGDIPATKAYGKRRHGDVFRMLRADYERMPEGQFKLMEEEAALIAIRTVEPIEMDTPPVSEPPMIEDDTDVGVPTKSRRGRARK